MPQTYMVRGPSGDAGNTPRRAVSYRASSGPRPGSAGKAGEIQESIRQE